ncbi:MAG: diaminopimelate decarboxylase [Coriobacteriales bacterium]
MSDESSTKRDDCIKTEHLGKVVPMTAKIDDSDIHEKHLWVGGVNLSKLPKTTTSPLYIYDEDELHERLKEYKEGLEKQFEKSRVSYAVKAFNCIAMDKIVDEEGCSLLVCSGGELAMALAAGFPAERIVMHGNNKSEDEITEALVAGVGTIIIDSIDEIGKIDLNAMLFDAEPNVMLRLRPGIHADTHTYIQTGDEDSKFGVSISNGEAMDAVKEILDSDNLKLKGFMSHIGSQIFNLEPFDKEIEVLIDFACKVRDELGYTAEEIDLGGGLGIAYTAEDEPTPIPEFCERIGKHMHEVCEDRGFPVPLVAVEPGRSIVGNAGVTCYRVGKIKDIPGIRTYVAVDGGMSDNIRPALYGAKYEAIIANKGYYPRTDTVTIVGKHCESGDTLIKDAKLQPAEEGDTICVFATGAYCYTMSSNYNGITRPGVTFVKDRKYRPVVRPQTYDDLMSCEITED